jgi:phosphatidate cytidylyltransferase
MLKTRIVTALVLAPSCIAAILMLQSEYFAYAWGVVILICAWEWSNLAGLNNLAARAGFVAVVAGLIVSAPEWATRVFDWLAWPVVAWWFVLSILLRRMPAKLLSINYPVVLRMAIGLFVLVSGWVLMVWLRANFGEIQVLYLFFLIAMADIAAYFVGKQWGFTKLLPEISPGKTTEGLYGALLATALIAGVAALIKQFTWLQGLDFVLLSVVTVGISVVGDLFESLAKRVRGVKDSGSILPGHGGLLDRVDSLIAAVSVFYAGSFFGDLFL